MYTVPFRICTSRSSDLYSKLEKSDIQHLMKVKGLFAIDCHVINFF